MSRTLGRLGRIQDSEHRTLHAAWAISEVGWQIYPVYAVDDEGMCACAKGSACTDPGKHPTTPHGFNDASSDPERIAKMFARWPGGNVGLKTGSGSDVVVFDVDPRAGGFASLRKLEAEQEKLPTTREHATGGGGAHLFYALPQDPKSLQSTILAPGIELKADGAGVVLPPSKHASGGRYEVLIAAPLALLPSWVLDEGRRLHAIEGGREDVVEQPESRFVLPERICEGARNRILYRYGCSLRAHGWDHASILAGLLRVNAERCVPPISDAEVRKIAQSAALHSPGNVSTITPQVLNAIAYLEGKARTRPTKGVGAHSRWAVYRALLDCAKRHGRMHRGRDVAVQISVRRLALDAGLGKSATLNALAELEASGLVYRASIGNGPVPGALALRVPDTDVLGPFVPPPSPLLLYRPRQLPSPFTGSDMDRGA